MGIFIKEGNGMSFNEAINQLMENIKKDYCKWSSHEKMIKEFKEKVRFTRGRKYTKILNGNSVWGFIANGDGVLKGIPCLLYTSPSPRDRQKSRMPSSA